MNERLVEFLYILARDELAMGYIESIMADHVTGGEPDEYCNPWLEGWARDMAERLTNEDVPVVNYNNMYKANGYTKTLTGSDARVWNKERPPFPVRADVVYSDQV